MSKLNIIYIYIINCPISNHVVPATPSAPHLPSSSHCPLVLAPSVSAAILRLLEPPSTSVHATRILLTSTAPTSLCAQRLSSEATDTCSYFQATPHESSLRLFHHFTSNRMLSPELCFQAILLPMLRWGTAKPLLWPCQLWRERNASSDARKVLEQQRIQQEILDANIESVQMRLSELASVQEYRDMYEFHPFTIVPAELGQKVLNPLEVDSFLKKNQLVTLKIQEENRKMKCEEQKYSAKLELQSEMKNLNRNQGVTNFEAKQEEQNFVQKSDAIPSDLSLSCKIRLDLNGTRNSFCQDEDESTSEDSKIKAKCRQSPENISCGANATLEERRARILHYKRKIIARRAKKPISKKFNGRSKIACQKLRINGKFVKKSELAAILGKAQ
ncbi:hypothetical protein FGO68_gene15323 [Halteria grandinella]|uniref:Uncharacterized protein n=1 Tax=Halteria grandinella TaxID=5974 RepID=A0A8J8NPV4_HALGN|nr:hypothetical protein FGO68_gene15323 [Halteria grandinella]